MASKKSTTNELKNKKISESMKKSWEARQALAEQINKRTESKIVAVANVRDQLRTAFVNLSPQMIAGVLDYQASGILMTWSDFCDYIQEMDVQLKALVQARTQNINSEKLIIKPKNQTPEAQKAADFIRDVLDDIPNFDRIIRQFLFAVFNGCQTGEIIYKRNEESEKWGSIFDIRDINMIPLKKMRIRLNPVIEDGERYETDATTGYGKWIYSYYNYGDNNYGQGIDVQTMWPGKFIIHSPGDEINLANRGLFRNVAWLWFLKQAGLAFWAAGAEKYAFPFLVGYVNKFAEDDTRLQFAANLKNINQADSMVTSDENRIEPINPGASGGDSVWKQFLQYINNELAKLIIGGTLTIEQGGSSSSRSQAEVHERGLRNIISTDANALAQTLRQQLVIPILQNNLHLFNGVMPPVPILKFNVSPKLDIPALLVDCGVVTNNELRESIELPLWTAEEGGNEIAKIKSTEDPMLSSIMNGNELQNASTVYNGKKKLSIEDLDEDVLNFIASKLAGLSK